ncbi:MAG TPA: glucoamylase family protein [Polyangia bacterium]|nr:glucoamylase family protein [Polyangia bacterium]
MWLAVLAVSNVTWIGTVGASPVAYEITPKQREFLERLQRDTFAFFWDESAGGNGLMPDRSPNPDLSSVAAVGFALTCYPIGVEKGWVTRRQAAERTLSTLRFLWRGRQGPEAQGIMGYKGFFYHFLDARTGHRAVESELSTIDTALLMAGVLASQAFFDRPEESERAIRTVADQLYRRVDWAWAKSPKHPPLVSMGWTPEQGFVPFDWQGYNEAMILYLLALGSPTHAIDPSAWEAWTSTYRWDASDGFPRVAFDPLFGHQYTHVWVDFRGIQDPYMRSRGIDYFVNSTRATYANRAYCIANPAKWVGYDEFVWGLTASDGPLKIVVGGQPAHDPSRFHAYWARGAGPDGRDDGTIAVTAAGGSVPFAPELAIPTLLQLYTRFGDRLYGKYGFKDAFNLSYGEAPSDKAGWFDDQYVAIDQGPIVLMIENFLSGRIWSLTKSNAYFRAGLIRAGFTGGWLDGPAPAPIPLPTAIPLPMPKPSENSADSPPGALVTATVR